MPTGASSGYDRCRACNALIRAALQRQHLPTAADGLRCISLALQEQEPSPAPTAVAVKPKASPAVRESAVSGGLRVPTSLRSAATMALEREEEAAAARRKRIDEMAIVRKVTLLVVAFVGLWV